MNRGERGALPRLRVTVLICLAGVVLALLGAPPAAATGQLSVTLDDVTDFRYPLDFGVQRQVRVTNIGAAAGVWGFAAQVIEPDGDPGAFASSHPQPGSLYLDPGESQTITLIADWINGFGVFNGSAPWQAGRTEAYTLRLTFTPEGGAATPAGPYDLAANVQVVAYPVPGDTPPANATVAGRITDAATGRPVAGQIVRVSSGQPPVVLSDSTDASGHYAVRVPAHRRAFLGGHPNEYLVEVVRSGYRDARTYVTPAPGATATADLALRRRTLAASYALAGSYDTRLPIYTSDTSTDGRYLITTPFHSGLSLDQIGPRAYLHVFQNDGTLLWRYHLGNEVTAADMSPDGTRVAVTRPSRTEAGHQWTDAVMVFSRAGGATPLWIHEDPAEPNPINGATPPGPSTVRISHGMTRLAYGSYDGRAYVLATGDLAGQAPAEHTQVWEATDLEGAVRDVEFSPDDRSVFFSSGDGYVHAFDTETGTRLWRAFIGSWAVDLVQAGNRLYASGKAGITLEVLDAATGARIWSYPLDTKANALDVSPDGRRVAIANSSAGSVKHAVFSSGGRLLWGHGASNQTLDISVDSGFMAASDGLNAYVTTMTGDELWRSPKLNAQAEWGAAGGLTAWSPDKTRFVTAPSNQSKVFFFKGAVRHPRTVTLAIGRSLLATGAVAVVSGKAACRTGVKVSVQRRTAAGWRTVATPTTAANGGFAVSLGRTGTYRAAVPDRSLAGPPAAGGGEVCGKGASVSVMP